MEGTKHFSTNIPYELYTNFKRLAQASDLNMSEVIRQLLTEWVEKNEREVVNE